MPQQQMTEAEAFVEKRRQQEKIYKIRRGSRGVSCVINDQQQLDPSESQRIRNHSPDGFEFGYGGSGPAQLALAILLDFTSREIAQARYQDFKFDFIATLPKEGGTIRGTEIAEWLNK